MNCAKVTKSINNMWCNCKIMSAKMPPEFLQTNNQKSPKNFKIPVSPTFHRKYQTRAFKSTFRRET